MRGGADLYDPEAYFWMPDVMDGAPVLPDDVDDDDVDGEDDPPPVPPVPGDAPPPAPGGGAPPEGEAEDDHPDGRPATLPLCTFWTWYSGTGRIAHSTCR